MAHRPLAVRLIAGYLLVKAAVLIACVAAVHFRPSVRSTANEVIEGLIPMIMAWREPAHDIWLAPIFALADATLGVGIWFLQKWARTLVVIDLAWLYGRALVGLPVTLALYYRDKVHFQNPSVYFDINFVAGIVMLAALCDPDMKRAFGMRF
jgi:hypothetical protein